MDARSVGTRHVAVIMFLLVFLALASALGALSSWLRTHRLDAESVPLCRHQCSSRRIDVWH